MRRSTTAGVTRVAWLVAQIVTLAFAATAQAAPRPGDVFREYVWRPEGKWQRVTGPDATAEGAKEFLPNSVNRIELTDLDGAFKAEACIEMLLCHAGTTGQSMRVNGREWIAIPEAGGIPNIPGTDPPIVDYQYMRYPCVPIPLEQLTEGPNTFEFTCERGEALGGWWPQWIVYGVTFRIYYDASKPHPRGRIVSPRAGATLSDFPTIEAAVEGPSKIKRIDFLGDYEDFNWEGDGVRRQLHYRLLYGEIQNHMGTATDTPWRIAWDTTWIPAPSAPFRITAKIVDDTNLCTMAETVERIRLMRKTTVRMYEPYDIPKSWATRAGQTDRCKIDVPDTLDEATAARLVLATWNGVAADVIGVNGKKVATRTGKNHDLSYDAIDVPLECLKTGTNVVHTYSDTAHHGIEMQWPGPVLFIRFE